VPQPDPKPAARIVDRYAGWTKVLTEGDCRVCGTRWPLTRHHLIKRSQGGDDIDDNLVPLCGNGTTGCHGRVEARDSNTLHLLRHLLTPEEVAYCKAKKGEAWLDRMYPW